MLFLDRFLEWNSRIDTLDTDMFFTGVWVVHAPENCKQVN